MLTAYGSTGFWSTSEPVQEIIPLKCECLASCWIAISIAGALMLQWDTSVTWGYS